MMVWIVRGPLWVPAGPDWALAAASISLLPVTAQLSIFTFPKAVLFDLPQLPALQLTVLLLF